MFYFLGWCLQEKLFMSHISLVLAQNFLLNFFHHTLTLLSTTSATIISKNLAFLIIFLPLFFFC